MKVRLFAALAVVILGIAGFFVYSRQTPAPDVEFSTLQGERFRTADLRGKVVLVNFWATTCVSCIEEMPMLARTHASFAGRGLETIAVAMAYDPPTRVKAYVEGKGLPFKVALDVSGELARGFDGVRLTPTTFLIDRRGRIVHKYLGEPDVDALHAALERLLAESV